MFGRGLLLRCPYCGRGKAYQGFLKMHRRCAGCGLHFEREPGYFLGASYLNYGVTVIACFAVTPIFVFALDWKIEKVIPIWIAVGTIVGLVFFRYARLFWLAMDLWWDPPTKNDFVDRDGDIRPLD